MEFDAFAFLSEFAHDSLLGRRAGTREARLAAERIALEFERAGLEAAGDSGYFQRVPLRFVERPRGRLRPVSTTWVGYDSLPASHRVVEANVIGLVRGSDPELREEYVLVTAHHDHLGVRMPVRGDSIYNGADDNASGVAGLVAIARRLLADPPGRSVVFAAVAGEELGMLGSRWYLKHPAVPLAQTVANFNLEMLGRPDPTLGPGRLWLTGHERTTMGEQLAAAGLPIAPDPRPGLGLYERSDNIVFARGGVPAHTLSSSGLHADYHTPDDEPDRIDRAHLEAAIEVALATIRAVADGPRPEWTPGGQP